MIQLQENILTPQEFCVLTNSAGWDLAPPEQVALALKNSMLTVTAVYDGKTVGMGRLCGDGALWYFLKDIVVLPEYQGKGVGRAIVQLLLERAQQRTPEGWKIKVELMSAQGKEPFYHKLGFEARTREPYGAGMTCCLYGKAAPADSSPD